ncbi:hypothetical protein N752_23770 [Desulforamulus aquiferis]|nr:hypothetical protein N752_23770 [Desulforamulus aquiferis]
MLYKRLLKYMVALSLVGILVIVGINCYIKEIGKKHQLNPSDSYSAQTAIVLGAYVSPEGVLCDMLKDRVETAVELYQLGKVKKLLMTGDHGQVLYDEVNHMRRYAEKLGVPTEDIFMDHAGFNTYDSMYRAGMYF